MRRTTRWFAGATAAIVAIATLALPGSPAHADVGNVPATRYTPVTLMDVVSPSYTMSQADGGVTIGCASGNPITRRIDASGVVTQNIANADPYANICVQNAAVGADGTLFTAATNGNGWPRFEAIKNGATQWTYVFPCRGTVLGAVMGTDGNVYVLYVGCNGAALAGFTAAGNNGSPAITFNRLVADGAMNGGIAAYNGGLVLRLWAGMQYVGYDGTVHDPISIPNLINGSYQDYYDATLAGEIPFAVKASSAEQQVCGNDSLTVGGVYVYGPTGQEWGYNSLPSCSHVQEMRPTPKGGIVLRYDAPIGGVQGNARAQHLLALNSSGAVLWRYDLPVSDSTKTIVYTDFSVDSNNNVALQTRLRYRLDTTGGSYQFPALQFVLLGGFSGAVLTTYELSDDHSVASGGGYDWYGNRATISIGKGTWYVQAMHCDAWSCDASTAKLYAISVPGLQMDYPRGAILAPATPQNYAALGDSYSSAEGVEPFLVGSDTSTDACHRSANAYARQLDGLPSLGWKLTTVNSYNSFVACSGANVNDLLNGRYGEPSQLAVLGSDTDAITLTLGGNDVPFRDFVIDCLFVDCSNPAFSHVYFDNISTLSQKLTVAYNAINTHARNARIYALGYPQLLPTQGCSQTDGWMKAFNDLVVAAHAGDAPSIFAVQAIGHFGGVSDTDINGAIASGVSEFNANEVATARSLVAQLDQAIQSAVNGIGKSWLTYIDPLAQGSPFIGHELCTATPYFNGLTINLANMAHDLPYTYHPNLFGEDAYKQLLLQQ